MDQPNNSTRKKRGANAIALLSLRMEHPSLDPIAFCERLELTVQRAWRAGTPRSTPKGQPLSGIHAKSYCSTRVEEVEVYLLDFALERLCERLAAHRKYLNRLHAEGGRFTAYVSWFTDRNSGVPLGSELLGRLAQLLGGLDGALAEFEAVMGEAWKQTAILVVTEFGRTARVNGTVGTDHGTATVAFLVGGAVKGGRVLADWPGLRPEQLYEARDLRPTTDLRAVMKGVLAEHLGLSAAVLGTAVFPDSSIVPPLKGLIV